MWEGTFPCYAVVLLSTAVFRLKETTRSFLTKIGLTILVVTAGLATALWPLFSSARQQRGFTPAFKGADPPSHGAPAQSTRTLFNGDEAHCDFELRTQSPEQALREFAAEAERAGSRLHLSTTNEHLAAGSWRDARERTHNLLALRQPGGGSACYSGVFDEKTPSPQRAADPLPWPDPPGTRLAMSLVRPEAPAMAMALYESDAGEAELRAACTATLEQAGWKLRSDAAEAAAGKDLPLLVFEKEREECLAAFMEKGDKHYLSLSWRSRSTFFGKP